MKEGADGLIDKKFNGEEIVIDMLSPFPKRIILVGDKKGKREYKLVKTKTNKLLLNQ